MFKMEDTAFIGRQPIIDLNQNIIGYELLFRQSATAQSTNFNDDLKTCSRLLLNTIGEIDTKWLLGDKVAFINVNEVTLNSELLELLPPNKTVLEILRSVQSNDTNILRCQELRRLGYKIALDNPQLKLDEGLFLKCADYIKIDIKLYEINEIENIIFQFNQLPLKIIAEKIETYEQFNRCKNSGIQLFQGYYFAKPETLSSKTINATFNSVINILNKINKDTDNSEIEAAFKLDAVLTFKLLKYINSVGFGLSCEINSINHALTILGRKQLYRWLTLLIINAGENSATPALINTSITRGRMTELLGATYFEKNDRDNLFVVGVFSLLDVMLQISMEKVLEKIHLPDEISSALLRRDGVYGPFLELSEACENSNSKKIFELAELLHLNQRKINECHMSALAWTEQITL